MSVLSGQQNRNTNGTCIVLVHKDKSRQKCYTTSPAHLATFFFQQISYFKTHQSSSSILELTVHSKMKDQQICNIISSRVILSPGYCRYCGSFLWKWMKNNPFLDTSFLFVTKNPALGNNPDFWSYLGF